MTGGRFSCPLGTATNELYLENLVTHGSAIGPISNTLYLGHLVALAAKLSRDEMTTIGAAYLFVPYCERLRTEFVAGKGLNENDVKVLISTHNSFLEASAIRTQALMTDHSSDHSLGVPCRTGRDASERDGCSFADHVRPGT